VAAIRRRGLQIKLRLGKHPKNRDGSTLVHYPVLSGEEPPELIRSTPAYLEEHRKTYAAWLMHCAVKAGAAKPGKSDLVVRAAFDTASDPVLSDLQPLQEIMLLRYQRVWYAYTGSMLDAKSGARPVELSLDTALRLDEGAELSRFKRALTQFAALEEIPVHGPIPAERALKRQPWDAAAWGPLVP
jgi:hypothetical protein